MKRVLTVQDLSCIGKCSISVALPVISSMGLETAVIPTAVLSNHTAFKSGYTYHSMTDNIGAVLKQWKKYDISFDCIYTGYLGTIEDIEIIKSFLDLYKDTSVLKIVDPAMADNGVLYQGLSEEYAEKMAELCNKADIIVPNLSEACIITGREYRDDLDICEIKEIMKELTEGGPSTVVLTSVKNSDGEIGVVTYDRDSDMRHEIYTEHLSGNYHGTGDVFASCLAGALTKGIELKRAVDISAGFVFNSIKRSEKDPDSVWYGINFEEEIPDLIRTVEKNI